MNYELHLITKILESNEPDKVYFEALNEITSSEALIMYGTEFKYIFNHKAMYGSYPDRKTFEEKTSQPLPEAKEPIKFYTDEVYKQFIFSNIANLSKETVDLLSKKDPIQAMHNLSAKLNLLNQVTPVSTDLNLSTTYLDRIQRYDNRRKVGLVSGIPCGWRSIDEETTGWQRSELVFLVGRMGTFKSWIIIAWAIAAWELGYSVLFFSREMGETQISRRIDTYITSTRFKDVKTGGIQDPEFDDFRVKLEQKFKNKHPFTIVDSARGGDYDIDFIVQKIREYKPDIVFGDGAYLIKGTGASEWERQTSITRGLKQICLSEKIGQIWTTQANRSGAGKEKVRIENISYSDSYGQDADVAISINRLRDERTKDYLNDVLIEFMKIRDGENKKVRISVDLNLMKLIEVGTTMDSNTLYDDNDEFYKEDPII